MSPKRAKGYHYDKKTKRHEFTIQFKGQRYRVRDKDEATARSEFEEIKRRLFDGADVKGAQVLLSVYLPNYIDTEVTGTDSTRDNYHDIADIYILPSFEGFKIEDIKRRHVIEWVNWAMNEPDKVTGRYWARSSIKQALGLLRRAFAAAVPEYLEYNPAADVRVPLQRKGAEFIIDEAPKHEKIFTPDQMAAFLAEVKRTDHQHGFYAYYLLMAEYGWRRGEGLGLRRKDVDFDAKTITIAQQVKRRFSTGEMRVTKPKSKAGIRALPATDDALAILRQQIMKVGAGRPTDLLFPGRNGKQRQPNGVTQHMRRVCKRLGFEGYTLHSLRKYAITDWRASGMDLEVAASLAGHAGVKITAETYSIPTLERKRAAMGKKKLP